MSTPQKPRWVDGQTGGGLPHEYRTEDQDRLDKENRRKTLVGVLEHVQRHQHDAVDFVTLVDALDLTEALDELVGSARRSPERHRRLEAARASAGLVDELDDQVE